MEKLKPSTEEIIKLGKKIVHEFEKEARLNTLTKWMSHYVAELIHKTENSSSEIEKREAEKECCDVILRIWSKRESIPKFNSPLNDLDPLLETLKAINNNGLPLHIRDLFPDGFDDGDASLKNFVGVVQNSTKDIFSLSLYYSMGKKIMSKKRKYKQDFESFLSEEEKILLTEIEDMLNPQKYNHYFSDEDDVEESYVELEEVSTEEWNEILINRIEDNVNWQQEEFKKFREKIQNSQ